MATNDNEATLTLVELVNALKDHIKFSSIQGRALKALEKINEEAKKELEEEAKKEAEEKAAADKKKADEAKKQADKETEAADAGHKSSAKGK